MGKESSAISVKRPSVICKKLGSTRPQSTMTWQKTLSSAPHAKRLSKQNPTCNATCVESTTCNSWWGASILFQMPAVAGRVDDESKTQPALFNIANRGLCLMGKSGGLQVVGDCSITLLGSARSSQHSLKGYVFGLKFYPSRSKEVRTWYVVIHWLHLSSYSLLNVLPNCVPKRMKNCSGRISKAFLCDVFLNASSNCLPEKMHARISCIFYSVLPCILRYIFELSAWSHWLHLFRFSLLCVFRCSLKLGRDLCNFCLFTQFY